MMILIHSFPAIAQDNHAIKKSIYDAYAMGKLDQWEDVITELEESWVKYLDEDILEELVMAQYGYIAFCLMEEEKKKGRETLSKANDNLEVLLAAEPTRADLIALKAAFTGFEMGFNPAKALYLASRAKGLTERAYNADSDNIVCLSVKANQLNFTPSIFGGSITEAIPYYKLIIDKYDSGEEQKDFEWRYINTLVIMAQAFEKLDNYKEACAIYKRIITEDPGILWVKKGLYPDCQISLYNHIKGQGK